MREILGPAREQELAERGFVIVADAIGSSTMECLREQLEPYLRGELMGRNDFEGVRSERVYRLLAKAPVVAELIEHEAVLRVADALLAPSYLLSAALVVQLHPGETVQGWHQDDALGAPPPPRAAATASWRCSRRRPPPGCTGRSAGGAAWGASPPAP